MTTRGFTLIEVLLSLALAGLLITVLMMQAVSFTNVWHSFRDDDAFEDHADGVTAFLSQCFARASAAPETPSGNSLAQADPEAGDTVELNEEPLEETAEPEGEAGDRAERQLAAVIWDKPPGYSEFDEPLLAFRQADPPAVLVNAGAKLPSVQAYLYFREGDGLGLLWFSALSEVEDLDEVRNTLLSPFVSKLEYAYYDREDEDWETSTEPEQERGQYLMPDFIRLTFTREEEEFVRTVYVPQPNADVPLF